ncbi:hypothetical protein ENSA5_06900 [Enhygromyxa salina]|uniref:Uncharacterized protein n=1 Tax=Enhygromyxa salina TaxID=215803 RepID=A0A2S9YHR8_9BACT|nr:hypothetical protein [Enhygromyxa salina]PRQ04566.1 hypothetical protein ENSA5_06900 [Enhygromyxa salina]
MPRGLPNRLPTRLVALLAPALLGACAVDLPDPRIIISHRVLAIRTEVTTSLAPAPELDADRPKAEALPFETVEITPFIVNEDGEVDPESLDIVWLACELTPGQGLFACLQSAMPLTLDEIPECAEPSFSDLMAEELPEPESPCLIAREGTPEYTVPLSANVFVGGAIELTMIAGVPGGTPTDTCAAELLRDEYDLPDDCLYAVQRLNLGPVELLLSIAANLGFEIPGFEVPAPEDIPEPDRHMRISEVRVGVINKDGEQVGDAFIVEPGDVFAAPRESTLQIEIDSPEEDLQSFLIPVNNGETYETRDEAYQGDWYRTWGEFLSGTSDDPMSYNQWTLTQGEQDETELQPGDRARVYYVVRDGRQGVNWFWFEVEVTEPLPAP